MPVKVRCPSCSKVLNAPEKARGKAIRCPDCQTVIRVPAEKQVVKQAVAPPPPSSSSIIANLDLKRLEDAENRICPRCGADVSPEDIECPKCEVMLETGQLSERKKAARSRKGPDPVLYYKTLIPDAWRFVMQHKKIALRTCTYSVLFSVLALVCALMVLWCSRTPPKTFWGFCGVVVLMVSPGWAWFLHTTIINSALENKKKLPKKVLFDFFQSSALGIKFFVWMLVMGAPLHALALVFGILQMPLWAAAFAGAGLVLALVVFPIAMVHMAMPVTLPAWKFWVMDGQFLRTMLPSLYWVFFLVLTMLPALAVAGGAAIYAANPVIELVRTVNHNVEIEDAVIRAAEMQKGPKGRVDEQTKQLSEEKPGEPDWKVLIIPSVCWVVASAFFGFASVFNMRSNGLFAVYFRDRLDLISMVDEIKYVPKPVVEEDAEKPAEMTWKKVALICGLMLVLGMPGGMIYGMISGSGLALGLLAGIYWAGVLVGILGGGMVLGAAFKASTPWGLACLFLPGAGFVLFVVMHWQAAKWGFIINVIGTMMIFMTFVLAIILGVAFAILGGPQEETLGYLSSAILTAVC